MSKREKREGDETDTREVERVWLRRRESNKCDEEEEEEGEEEDEAGKEEGEEK